MTLKIWAVGSFFDEHYTIAEDIYPSLKPAIKEFYARVAQAKAAAKGDEKERFQAIFDQMTAAQTEFEEGNG